MWADSSDDVTEGHFGAASPRDSDIQWRIQNSKRSPSIARNKNIAGRFHRVGGQFIARTSAWTPEYSRLPQEEVRRRRNGNAYLCAVLKVLLFEEGQHVNRPAAHQPIRARAGEPSIRLVIIGDRNVELA
jgi:hypothetical protein